MTGINYYIKFFRDGVASQWLGGYGIRWGRVIYRGFGIWKEVAPRFKEYPIHPSPNLFIGLWIVWKFETIRIPTRRGWNRW